MARKRMFDIEIVDTDLFLEMPPSTRLLYYDLGMRADDDGFVSNPKKLIKMTNATEDDLKVLISKCFIIPFDTGVCVIRHWKINNYLRKDRHTETLYKEELEQLSEDGNGAYVLREKLLGIPVVDIDKISKAKKSIEENSIYSDKSLVRNEAMFNELWKIYPNKKGKTNAYKKYLKTKVDDETIRQGILNYISYIKLKKIQPQFIKHGSTWFNEEAWNDDYSEVVENIEDKKARFEEMMKYR